MFCMKKYCIELRSVEILNDVAGFLLELEKDVKINNQKSKIKKRADL